MALMTSQEPEHVSHDTCSGVTLGCCESMAMKAGHLDGSHAEVAGVQVSGKQTD